MNARVWHRKNLLDFMPKCAASSSNGKPKFTAKSVSRRNIQKHLHHKDYLHTLKETESTIATFSTLRSQKQQIKTIELTKKCLNAFDDKRYILNDGITTLAYGHYKIVQIKSA